MQNTETGGDAGAPLDLIDGQGFADASQGQVDRAGIARVTARYHALFLQGSAGDIARGQLEPALEAKLRRDLKPLCGGYLSEEDDAVLAVTSPTGNYIDHPLAGR